MRIQEKWEPDGLQISWRPATFELRYIITYTVFHELKQKRKNSHVTNKSALCRMNQFPNARLV